jgi:hypothetical protein
VREDDFGEGAALNELETDDAALRSGPSEEPAHGAERTAYFE